MHYDYADMDWEDLGAGWTRAVVILKRGDTAHNPASTKGPIYGPKKLTYERAPSGTNVILEDAP